ncbi:MAG TPA: phosphatidate cytidylyltransferase [Acidimicrobiia bacterium]|nr:phosphatidate cytidylyltransferase [Acidimicrobiia bacterium]
MSERTPEDENGPSRLWDEGEEDAEVFTLPPLLEEDDAGEDDSADDADPGEAADGDPAPAPKGDYEGMSFPQELDDYQANQYTGSTTQEYQGLAEEVSRAAEEEWEQQAVAATVPGVDSGLVGFEDVTGSRADTEEDFEATEQAASSDLAMRVGSAVVIFGLFLGSLLLGGWWFAAFVILAMVVSTGEFYATVRSDETRPLALFGLLGVVFMGVGAQLTGAAAIAGWAAAFAVLTILFLTLSPRRQPLDDASVTIGGMVWVGLLSFAILIAQGSHPVAYILFVVLLVAANDTGAYFVGRSLGRRKLSPVISPHKTVEGLIGGFVAGLVVASILATFPAWETIGIAKALVAGAVVGVIAPLGDTVESMVKRSLGVKDMGSVLPGHGGMLDRIDGFLFVAPAIYFLFRGFGLL